MRGRFIHQAMLAILLICQFSVCLGKNNTDPNESSKYLNAVIEFALNVLEHGRDKYGPKHTPLFVDGLNIHTHEPVKWISPEGERWILSNFASQQTLLRTLDGLSSITGDAKYRHAATDAIRYMFDHPRTPSGLFYWGQLTAYDALGDIPRGNTSRESIKIHYPYYELMWKVDPDATKKLIEALWCAHVMDWSNLDFNRIGMTTANLEEPWNHEYKGGPTFFKSKSGGVGFFTTATSLIQAGTTLYRLSRQEQPLVWSKRLAHRFVQTRHPKTGIALPVYNYLFPLLGDDLKEHFLDPRTRIFPWHAFEETRYLYYPENIEAQVWLSLILVGDTLGKHGKEFKQWAIEELTAWGKASYRKKDNSFVPILTDGTSIEGYVSKKYTRYAPKGAVAKPLFADLSFFWGYAVAYRATSDEFMWEMMRNIAFGNDFGDIGETSINVPKLRTDTTCCDVYGLLGFLELYGKTRKPLYLKMSRRIGDNILLNQLHKGFFVPSKRHIYTRFDCFEPLALLHLHATIKSKTGSVPQVWPSYPLFVPPYRYKQEGVDRRIIYTLTESSEPPLSLQEAAAIGDVELVRSLLEKGVGVDSWDDSFSKTALQHAAMNGHREVVALLIAKGARIDANTGFPGGTALDYAAEKGHKEIAELLIARGADVNAKREYPAGDTPLHSAVRAGRKDVLELLIAKGADVNAKNDKGQTPLDVAVGQNRKDIVDLLAEKGASMSSTIHWAVYSGDLEMVKKLLEAGTTVDAKDAEDNTALHLAVISGHKEVAELLISKGASVNAKNNAGQTPTDLAVIQNRKDIVELLVEKGADVSLHLAAYLGDLAKVRSFIEKGADANAKDEKEKTPLHYAARRGHKEIVEVLLAHGADVNSEGTGNRTAAEFAMGSNHREIVQLLVSKGADISPLHIALYMEDQAKAKSLIEAGVDINKRTPYGTTSLHRAVSAGFNDLAAQLIAKGADVNAKDNWNWTPLHSAAYYGNKDMVEMLIVKGADVTARDGGGRTPLWHAQDKGHAEIAELLRKHGAKE